MFLKKEINGEFMCIETEILDFGKDKTERAEIESGEMFQLQIFVGGFVED